MTRQYGRGRRGGFLLGLLTGLLLVTPARAVITSPTPLQVVLTGSKYIGMVRVERLDPGKPGMVLVSTEDLKGKAPFQRLLVNLKGDAEAAKNGQTPLLLKRVAPKLPLVLFVNPSDRNFTAVAYTNGTWFQMTGVQTNDGVRWGFTHFEPYLRKTFKGTTADLRQVIRDVLAGRKKAPPLDKKEKPGLGPEVEPPQKIEDRGSKIEDSRRGELGPTRCPAPDPRSSILDPRSSTGPLFAVIPTVFVGGPLAILAVLFPAVFGGLTLVLRRWMAALSVLSLNSTLYLAQGWFAPRLTRSWWGTPLALWLSMTVVTLLGILWAWHRHLRGMRDEGGGMNRMGSSLIPHPSSLRAPGRAEPITLGVLSLASVVAVLFWLPHSLAKLGLWDKTLLLFSSGLWVATLHALYLRGVLARRRGPRAGLPGEGVMLWTMMLACVLLGATFTDETLGGAGPEMQGGSESPYQVVWRFKPRQPCWFASSPCVDGDRVLVGVVHPSAFNPSGAVCCIDRLTGKLRWTFNDGGRMKDVFSSPAVSGGRVYVGEGFHQHNGCKLYCLDADSGQKRWEFPTGSHTESSPCVVNGNVYFGAGDDGLYCLDAATGRERWHHNGLHVDANPLVVGDRLYGGSGVGDRFKETMLFCLDAATGKEQWRVPTDLPVWGMPAAEGGRLYAPLGNGNFLESAERPAGAVLCLEAATGEQVWRFDARDGVHTRVAADARNVYFGSRDQHCYCVDRQDGSLRWKQDLGSPVVASPALVEDGRGAALYVVSSAGRVCRLDAATGKVGWAFDVRQDTGKKEITLFSSPAVVVNPGARGERHRIYFGSGLDDFSQGILYCLEDDVQDGAGE